MANVHAAIKQIRKDVRKRERNQATLSELKTLWRKFDSLPANDAKQAPMLARELVSSWDRAASRGIVPVGRADRKKTRIAYRLAKFTQSR